MKDLLCRLEEEKWAWTSFAIKEFKEEFVRDDENLINDFTSVNSPENEILQLKNVNGYLLKKSKEEENQLIEQKELIEEEFNLSEQELNKNSRQLQKLSEKLKNLEEEKSLLEQYKMEIEYPISIERWESRTTSTRKTSVLDSEFNSIQDRIQKRFEAQVQKFNRDMKTISMIYECKLTDLEFEFTEAHLSLTDEYKIETYFSKKNFNRDCQRVESLLHQTFQDNYEKWKRACNHFLKEMEMKLNGLISVFKMEKEDLEFNHYKRLIQYSEQKNRLSQLEKEIKQAHQKWESHFARSQKLNFYLKEAFLAQFNDYQKKILGPDVLPEEKWLYHQYLNIMQKQAEGIIQSD